MAYAIKYLFKFESLNHTTREIRILQDGYSGEVIQRPLGQAPVLKKQQNGPIHGTSLTMYAQCDVDREYIEFYTSDPKEYRVDIYAGNTLLWQGWITPELYSEPDIAPPYDVQVVATDGVGELKLYDFAPQGTVTLRSLLSYLLGNTGLSTDVLLVSSLKAGGNGAGALLNMNVNMDYMSGKTCYDVLTYLLDTLHATISWWKGAWMLVRETNVTFSNGKLRYYNTSGNSALMADSVQDLGSLGTNNAWPVGQLTTVIDPAKNKVTVQAPWHPVTCLANPEMASDTGWVKANNATYSVDGYLFPNPGSPNPVEPVIYQSVALAGLRVPMTFKLTATNVSAQFGYPRPNGGVIGVLITYTVGSTVYHLRKGDDGTPVWREGGAVDVSPQIDGNLIDYQQPLMSVDADRISADSLEVPNIPAFYDDGAFPAGTLRVYVTGDCAKVYTAYLDVILPKGYQDILQIDNDARGESDEVEVAFGRASADTAYYAPFLQGILLDGTTLITAFQDATFTTNMDFLSFISRDYALSVALPRARFNGTVFLEAGVSIPPLVFSKGSVNYWVETFAWDMYEDELQISIKSLPVAALTVEGEAFSEATSSAESSSQSSAGGSSSAIIGGGGEKYFEGDADFGAGVALKPAYDALRVPGIRFGAGESNPDLYVDIVEDSQGNPQRVLRSPLPLITDGDQIVEDGEPGDDSGGLLRLLDDVYHDDTNVKRLPGGNVGDTDILAYDSERGWYAAQLGLNLSMEDGVVNASGSGGGTTYTSGTVAELKEGSGTVDRVWKPKVLADWLKALGYVFGGYATPASPARPQEPSSNTAYLATAPGVYANLGNIEVVQGEVALILYDGSWHKLSTGIDGTYSFDAAVTAATTYWQTIYGNFKAGDVIAVSFYGTSNFDTGGVTLRDDSTGIVATIANDATNLLVTIQRDTAYLYFYRYSTAVSSSGNTHGEIRNYHQGCVYLGQAAPSTNPGTPGRPVYYTTATAGIYTNFGGIVVNDGEVVQLVWFNGWSKVDTGAATSAQLASVATNANFFVLSNNQEFNAIVHELYIPAAIAADLANITEARIMNNYGGQSGLILRNTNTGNYIYLSGPMLFGDVAFDKDAGDASCVLDVSRLADGERRVITGISLNVNVGQLDFMPRLAGLFAGRVKVSNSNWLNYLIDALYIPTSELSDQALQSVALVRIYKGFQSYYGVTLYDSSSAVIKNFRITSATVPSGAFAAGGALMKFRYDLIPGTYVTYTGTLLNVVRDMNNFPALDTFRIVSLENANLGGWFEQSNISPMAEPADRPLVYEGDTKSNSSLSYINNAVIYPDGVIIAARTDGTVVRISLAGVEAQLLAVSGSKIDWRGLFMDSRHNVFASPHATFGSLTMTDRGLYKLAPGGNAFTKVISLYDPSSQDPHEAEQNDDTIWTMCEDCDGYLYAGVYAHTVRNSPRIYRSADGGDTWGDLFDFSELAPTGKHMHCIIYNQYNNALYAIVGEVNTIFKSTDHGESWTNLGVACEDSKGTAMIAVPDGVLIGSDSAYSFLISKMYADESHAETKARFWASTCFGLRRSDATGWLYAFGKMDSSINTSNYMPPIEALTDQAALNTWIASGPTHLADWQKYHNNTKDVYPEDCIRPTHFGIYVSKDNGESWECIFRQQVTSQYADGILCVGYFRNGECLCARMVEHQFAKPLVISEGKHRYGANGLNLDGEIIIRTDTSTDVTALNQ